MVEKDLIYKAKVRHKGIFDFGELYRFCYNWFIEKDYRLDEKKYSEKVKPNGKEVEIIWEVKRKISDYFRFVIKMNWLILQMTDVEVEQEGKRVKMNKGDLEMSFQAILEKDYEHRWEQSSFLKFLRGVYDRYIIKGRIEKYEEKIFGELDESMAQIKAFLALEGKH